MKRANTDALSPRMKAKFAKYVPRTREENEAPPRTLNFWASPVLTPISMSTTRPGADAHKSIRSHGVPT